MTEAAPVCLLPNRGQAPALQAGVRFPTIGRAGDLPSALAVAANIIEALTFLLGPDPFPNNLNPYTAQSLNPGSGGTPGITESFSNGPAAGKGKDGKDEKKVQYIESGRRTQHIKVVNPDDDDQFIFIERIVSLNFSDNKTGGTIFWEGVNLG